MDALSAALSTIRLTSPLVASLTLGADISISFMGSAQHPGATPFHFILSGTCQLKQGNYEAELTAGDMVMLPGSSPHSLETGCPNQHFQIIDLVKHSGQPLWSPERGLDVPLHFEIGSHPTVVSVLSGIFTFDETRSKLILRDLPRVIFIPEVGASLGELMRAGTSFILNERQARPGFAATTCRLLEAILTESLRSWAISSDHPPGLLNAVLDDELGHLIQAIYASPGDPWSVSRMAEFCAQSKSTLVRRFRGKLGISPKSFVSQIRQEHAEWQLRHTSTPIAKIAEAAGYRSTFAFSRAFKEQAHLTPFAFRHRRVSD